MSDNQGNIRVSICCIAYNHASYIKQCLDGFLMQQCEFDFEILIHDDASTDGTMEIIKEYHIKYPDIIKPIFQTENQWSKGIRNLHALYNYPRAKGKYIAFCEGDDYWTESLKLQKQVDALEMHPEINICAHPSFRQYGDKILEDGYCHWGNTPKIISPQHVIKYYGGTAGMQSILIRNVNTQILGQIGKNLQGGHSALQIFYAIPNGLYYLPNYMAVYRKGSVGSISKIIFKKDAGYLERQKINWKGLALLDEYTKFQFHNEFENSKRLRAIVAIGTGFLTTPEKLKLITEYRLYKNFPQLIKAFAYPYYDKLNNNLKKKKELE